MPPRARLANWLACLATASESRITGIFATGTNAVSFRSTTFGSNIERSFSKSPVRDAARNASTSSRFCLSSAALEFDSVPLIRRRARLASFLAAASLRPMIEPISEKDKANISCKTNAIRSAGFNFQKNSPIGHVSLLTYDIASDKGNRPVSL